MAISGATRVCAVIGDPVAHSLSPALHNAAFAAAGLDFAYVAFRVTDVAGAVAGVRGLGIRGLSVTIPHKETILARLDRIDPLAAKIGAVNTVVNDDGLLTGCNTDAAGISHALAEAGITPAGRPVVIIGAGGVARAAAFAVLDGPLPAALVIVDPVPGKAEVLAADVRAKTGFANVAGHESKPGLLEALLAGPALVINASPLGMHPHEDKSPVPEGLLRAEHAAFDVVYTPAETTFIRAARAAGARVATGDRMFLRQAMEQFRLWTGTDAPETVMAGVLKEKLGN